MASLVMRAHKKLVQEGAGFFISLQERRYHVCYRVTFLRQFKKRKGHFDEEASLAGVICMFCNRYAYALLLHGTMPVVV